MQPQQIFLAAIGELKIQVTHSTFDMWIAPLRLNSYDPDRQCFLIDCPDSYTVDYLSNRIHSSIVRTFKGIAGREVGIEYIVTAPPDIPISPEIRETDPGIVVSPMYSNTANELLQPNKNLWVSHYFLRRWGPLLGNDAMAIVMCLRMECFYNRRTGERRESIRMTQAQIARSSNISERTLWKILKARGEDPGHPLNFFILEIDQNFFDSDGRNTIRRLPTSYRVRVDDPLTPEDELFLKRLDEIADSRKRDALIVDWRDKYFDPKN